MLKRIISILVSILLVVDCTISAAAASTDSQSMEERINQTLSQMTLHDRSKLTLGGLAGQQGQSTDDANQTKAEADKGLSYMDMSDGPLGVNAKGPQTSFGSGLVIASTWNKELTKQVGEVIGKEALAKNVQISLGPGTNILRDLTGGRTFEYYSEDPYLASNVVAPYIEGVQSEGVMSTVKHLIANNQEWKRNFMSSNMSERTLHEVYLKPFQAAVESADVWGAMTAANRMNGVFTSDNRYILTNMMKYDFGFKGIVMTDWCNTRTGIIAAKAGLDLAMPPYSSSPFDSLENYVRSGQLDIKYVNEAAQRLVRTAYLTKSMISTDKVDATGYTAEDRKTGEANTPSNQAVSRQVAEEGSVLLKNQNSLLPLDKTKVQSIALLGKYVNYNYYIPGLGGSGATNPPYQITNIKGLKNKLGDSFNFNVPTYNEASLDKTIADAVAAAKSSEYAIVFAGLNSTSVSDPNVADSEDGDRQNLDFPAAQLKLIQAVAAANSKTIVVLSGSVFEVRDWIDQVPSVLQTFYPGMEGGNAVADILFGDTNPSGKLTFTWPKRYSDTEGYIAAGGENNQKAQKANDVNYKEGIYVGYKWNDKQNITPEFAFGHGLSYTNFEYSNLRFDKTEMGKDGTIQASVDVKNMGTRAGEEVAQLYIHADDSTVEHPTKELKGYEKVSLESGETKTVTFNIDADSLSYWDVNVHSFMAKAGNYEAWIGGASDDIKLQGTFALTEDTLSDSSYQVVQGESTTNTTNTTTLQNEEIDGGQTSYIKLNGSDSSAKWNVNVSKAGKYSVIFRYSNNGYSGDVSTSFGPNKTTSLLVNGKETGNYDFQNTRGENIWNYDSVDVELAEGSNEIALKATDKTSGLNVDKMVIQTINTTTPDPSACAPDDGEIPPPEETKDGTAFQMENAIDLFGGVVSTDAPNFTGTGYVNLSGTGSYVTTDILTPTFNDYRLSLYYANGNSTPSPSDLYVNGVKVATYNLPPTGGWSKWKFEQSPTLHLFTGLNEIKLVTNTQSVSMDKIVLSGGMGFVDSTPPTINATSPADNDTINNMTGVLSAYFSEEVEAGDGINDIALSDGTDTVKCSATINGTFLSLQPEKSLEYDKEYTVTIPKNAIKDAAGNAMSEDYSFIINTPKIYSYDCNDGNISYTGEWNQQDSYKTSNKANASYEVWFDGVDAKIYVPQGPNMGTAKVYLDDSSNPVKVIDLYASEASEDAVVYDTGTLTSGFHKIKVVATGTNDGAASDAQIGLEKVSILGTISPPALSIKDADAKAFSFAVQSESPSCIIDGDPSARWSSGRMQSAGQWFTLDFKQPTQFSALVMYTPNDDYIRGYEVYVSDDGETWGNPVTSGSGAKGYTTIHLAEQSKRYVKVVQTGAASGNWWCVNELYAFDKKVIDTENPTPPEYLSYHTYYGQINVKFVGATDNIGVVGYHVYRDGEEVATTADSYYLDTDVVDGKEYTYSVKSFDVTGNVSEISDNLTVKMDPTVETTPEGNWIASASNSASASPSNGAPICAIDGTVGTRWTSGKTQDPSLWFSINMGSKFDFNKIEMNSGNNDYPRGYEVLVSDDGINWSNPVASGEGNPGTTTIALPRQTAQYIKIHQTGSSSSWWSIYELTVSNKSADKTISSFEELDPSIKSRSVANGTSYDSLNLPVSLNATVDGETGTISDITWSSDSTYDSSTSGSYIFTPALPKGYVLDSGVTLPEITVTVASTLPTDKTINSFDKLDPAVETQNVANGTPLSSLNLPTVLKAVVNGISGVFVKISEWISSITYDPMTAGEYDFTPVFDSGYVLDSGVTLAKIKVNVGSSETTDKTISSFGELDSSVKTQSVKNGTPLASLNLPTSLQATVNEGTETISGITWLSKPTYNSTVSGVYTFTAKQPGGYVLGDKVSLPTIVVVVAAVQNNNSGHHSSGDSSSNSSSNTTVTTSSTVTTISSPTGGTIATVTTQPDSTPVVTSNHAAVSVTVPADVTSIISAATAVNPAVVKITVPTASIVEQLQNNAVSTVDLTVQVPSTVANNTNANATVSINVEPSVLQAAKDAQKDVTLNVTDTQTGAVAYSWTFSGANLNKSTAPVTNVNLAISVQSVQSDAAASAATANNAADKKAAGLLLKFGSNGLLPAPATVRVCVGNQSGITPNSKIYLYYFNSTTNALEQLPQSEYTVDANGYVTVTISHCSDYVLLPKAATNPYPVKSDTTFATGVKNGKTYTFAMTVSGNALPSFAVGNGKAFTSMVKKVGNKYYFTVNAVGTVGTMTAVYSTLPGQKPVALCYISVVK